MINFVVFLIKNLKNLNVKNLQLSYTNFLYRYILTFAMFIIMFSNMYK